MERNKIPGNTQSSKTPNVGREPKKFIAEGSYGCVFRPALSCMRDGGDSDRDNDKKGIGKVFQSDIEYRDELANFKLLSKEINSQNIFSPRFIKHCAIDALTMSPQQVHEFKKCHFVDGTSKTKIKTKKGKKEFKNHSPLFTSPSPSPKYASDSSHKYSQIVMEDGGLTLTEQSTNFFNIFFNSKSLFEGIAILQKHEKSHLDIKDDNIVYDKTMNRMLLIDYGFMTSYKNVYTNVALSTNYSLYPPEFRFAEFVLNEMSSKSAGHIQDRVEGEILNPLFDGITVDNDKYKYKNKYKYMDVNYISSILNHAMNIAREVNNLDGNKDNIKIIVAKFHPDSRNKELSSFVSYFFKLYDEMAKKHMQQLLQSKGKKNVLTDKKKNSLLLNIFNDELAKKIDSYALGILFLTRLGREINVRKVRINKKNQDMMTAIISLLQGMTHANPFERYDAIEAHRKYIEILSRSKNTGKIY